MRSLTCLQVVCLRVPVSGFDVGVWVSLVMFVLVELKVFVWCRVFVNGFELCTRQCLVVFCIVNF